MLIFFEDERKTRKSHLNVWSKYFKELGKQFLCLYLFSLGQKVIFSSKKCTFLKFRKLAVVTRRKIFTKISLFKSWCMLRKKNLVKKSHCNRKLQALEIPIKIKNFAKKSQTNNLRGDQYIYIYIYLSLLR